MRCDVPNGLLSKCSLAHLYISLCLCSCCQLCNSSRRPWFADPTVSPIMGCLFSSSVSFVMCMGNPGLWESQCSCESCSSSCLGMHASVGRTPHTPRWHMMLHGPHISLGGHFGPHVSLEGLYDPHVGILGLYDPTLLWLTNWLPQWRSRRGFGMDWHIVHERGYIMRWSSNMRILVIIHLPYGPERIFILGGAEHIS